MTVQAKTCMKCKPIYSHKYEGWMSKRTSERMSETYRTQLEEDISIRRSMRSSTIPVTPGTEERQTKDKGHV